MNSESSLTKENLLEVINHLPLAVAVIDQETIVRIANRSVQRFVNRKGGQLIGRSGGEAFGCSHAFDVPAGCGYGPDCQKCTLRDLVTDSFNRNEANHNVELSFEFMIAGTLDLRISTVPILLEGRRVVILSLEDLTDAKRQEKTLIYHEKLKAAVETGGAVCHEMNQPLQILSFAIDNMVEELGGEGREVEELLEVGEQIVRLGELTKKFMNISGYHTKKYLNKIQILDIDKASKTHEEIP
ncbi:MAG: histidine kinase [Desulfobacterium sp.]|nr:histidine kinase [Desulfobacterium sp.]